VVPARQEAALLTRFGSDLAEWRRTVDGQVDQTLRGLGVELLHVLIAVAIILVGALVWRLAVNRYVGDAYRRHLLLTVRNVVAGIAVALVIAFHFTTELASLVTALGFAAAGIAFALQTIIVALAGYFAIVAPNGIRVGDRVSLQGPYGWVQGDVVDIGFLRIKLRELTGEPPQPTGRIVVFPNSVVFTGSFFKHPQRA
jgi:small-conductance mechanosensitive channel